MGSIKKFADYIKTTYGGFDVLVNNAAIAYKVCTVYVLVTIVFDICYD